MKPIVSIIDLSIASTMSIPASQHSSQRCSSASLARSKRSASSLSNRRPQTANVLTRYRYGFSHFFSKQIMISRPYRTRFPLGRNWNIGDSVRSLISSMCQSRHHITKRMKLKPTMSCREVGPCSHSSKADMFKVRLIYELFHWIFDNIKFISLRNQVECLSCDRLKIIGSIT